MKPIAGLHIFIKIEDTAQATVDIEPERIYFALATSDTMDHGSVKSCPELLVSVTEALSRNHIHSLPGDTELKVAFDFTDGTRSKTETAESGTENLNSMISILVSHSSHLEFLTGFAVN